MLKFRNMYADHCDAPDAPIRQASPDAPRITRVGRWLRCTSLVELSQLWNVLRGEMNLVGPRPRAVGHDEELARRTQLYFSRYWVKPGMTGLAQIRGYRGELDTPEKLKRRIAYDLAYVREWSLALDLWILALTPLVLLRGPAMY